MLVLDKVPCIVIWNYSKIYLDKFSMKFEVLGWVFFFISVGDLGGRGVSELRDWNAQIIPTYETTILATPFTKSCYTGRTYHIIM